MDQERSLVSFLVSQANEKLAAPPLPVVFVGDAEADALLNDLASYPHALVLACLMDRQMKAEKAWAIPHELRRRLGTFSFSHLAALTAAECERVMLEPQPLHRFSNVMSRTLRQAIVRIRDTYGGDASRIWSGNPSSAGIVRRFLEFDGAGPKIATMAANILVRDLRVPVSDRYSIDVSADVHIRRVFSRLGLVAAGADESLVIFRARELWPKYPGIFDLALWELGRSVCRPTGPQCQPCNLGEWCRFRAERCL